MVLPAAGIAHGCFCSRRFLGRQQEHDLCLDRVGILELVHEKPSVLRLKRLADIGSLLISQLVTDAVPAAPPFDILLGAAFLNAGIVALLLFPARALAQRYAPEEAPAW